MNEYTFFFSKTEPPASPSDIVVRHVEKNEATIQWMIPYSGNSPITRFVVQYWRDTGIWKINFMNV